MRLKKSKLKTVFTCFIVPIYIITVVIRQLTEDASVRTEPGAVTEWYSEVEAVCGVMEVTADSLV